MYGINSNVIQEPILLDVTINDYSPAMISIDDAAYADPLAQPILITLTNFSLVNSF